MKIENCWTVGFTNDRPMVSSVRGRTMGYVDGRITLEIILPPGRDMLLPPGFAERKITIIFEPTPGEAAYLKHNNITEATGKVFSWENLDPPTREHWERVAQAAIQAK